MIYIFKAKNYNEFCLQHYVFGNIKYYIMVAR